MHSQKRPTAPKKGRSKRIHRPQEQGAALIVVISIMLILTLLGAGTFNSSMRDFTISMNRTHAQSAEMIAQAALNLVINRIETDPLGFVSALDRKPAESQNAKGCQKARTLCLTPASFFPATGVKRSNNAFNVKALLPDIALATGADPSVYPDFTVQVDPPIKSPYSKPAAGMSLNAFARMCTITIVMTATGRVINPNITDVNNHRHVLATRIYRVHLNVAMKGDPC